MQKAKYLPYASNPFWFLVCLYELTIQVAVGTKLIELINQNN